MNKWWFRTTWMFHVGVNFEKEEEEKT